MQALGVRGGLGQPTWRTQLLAHRRSSVVIGRWLASAPAPRRPPCCLRPQGEIATHMYFIRSGTVEIYHSEDPDNPITQLGAGSYFGEFAILAVSGVPGVGPPVSGRARQWAPATGCRARPAGAVGALGTGDS